MFGAGCRLGAGVLIMWNSDRSVRLALVAATTLELFVLIVLAGSRTASADLTWDGASGLLPDEIIPAWTLVDTASPEDPILTGGILTIATYRGS